MGCVQLRSIIVTQQSATLGLPNTREQALNATHSDLVKMPSRSDGNYVVVADTLQRIIHSVIPRRRARLEPPPSTPPATTGGGEEVQIRRINFGAHVSMLDYGTPAQLERLHVHTISTIQVSDIQDRALSALLGLPAESEAADTTAAPPPRRLFWAHIPLNNTLWVNVSKPTPPLHQAHFTDLFHPSHV